jgi:hypothetical protein
MSTSIGVWIAGILTLAAYSFLYKENPFFRVAEFALVGSGSGYALALGWKNISDKVISPLGNGKMIAVLPLVLGLLLFTKLSKRHAWMARYPMAVLVGLGASVALRAAVKADLLTQIRATMLPLNTLNNVIIVFGTIGVVSFFFFTLGVDNSLRSQASRIGRIIMMVAFGAQLGSAAAVRTSLFIGRVVFVFRDWLGLIK